jgi:hypothetical protein
MHNEPAGETCNDDDDDDVGVGFTYLKASSVCMLTVCVCSSTARTTTGSGGSGSWQHLVGCLLLWNMFVCLTASICERETDLGGRGH